MAVLPDPKRRRTVGRVEEPEEPRELNPMPFVAALVVVTIAVVVGYLFLRPDDSGELLRPDRLEVVDDDTIRAIAFDRSPCERILRAQVDMDVDAVFVELVVDRGDEPCTQVVEPIQAEITLPEPVEGRQLRAGIGRFGIPCTGTGSDVTCEPDR